jgi:hypothetical protein
VGKGRKPLSPLGFVGCCILRQCTHWIFDLIVVLRTLIVSDFSKRFSDVKRPQIIIYGQSVPITPHYGNFGRGGMEDGGSKTLKAVAFDCP